MTQRTTTISLSYAEAKAQSDGSVHLVIGGSSVNGVSHKLVIKMAPSTIGYIGQDLHRVVADLQKTLDTAKTLLSNGAE